MATPDPSQLFTVEVPQKTMPVFSHPICTFAPLAVCGPFAAEAVILGTNPATKSSPRGACVTA